MAQVFISYRRAPNGALARLVWERLKAAGIETFRDIEEFKKRIGDDFTVALDRELSTCKTLIAIMGPKWATLTDEKGARRLHQPEDFVRREITAALKGDILVIPLLVDGADMPDADELPDELKRLTRLQALSLYDDHFDEGMNRLIERIRERSRKPESIIVKGCKLLRIPNGRFEMGSPDDEIGRALDEKYHEVRLTGFWLGKRPVTNEEYGQFLAENPKAEKPKHWEERGFDNPRQAVVGISWDDARAYCEWAGLRLPSEAEWEYACRAGTSTRFYSGNEETQLDEVGWYAKNSESQLPIVGEKRANEFWLHDMHGNVWEWCEDIWHPSFYEKSDENGLEPLCGAGSDFRVVRGGSWRFGAMSCRSACRGRDVPTSRFDDLGFRPAKTDEDR